MFLMSQKPVLIFFHVFSFSNFCRLQNSTQKFLRKTCEKCENSDVKLLLKTCVSELRWCEIDLLRIEANVVICKVIYKSRVDGIWNTLVIACWSRMVGDVKWCHLSRWLMRWHIAKNQRKCRDFLLMLHLVLHKSERAREGVKQFVLVCHTESNRVLIVQACVHFERYFR